MNCHMNHLMCMCTLVARVSAESSYMAESLWTILRVACGGPSLKPIENTLWKSFVSGIGYTEG